MNSNGASPAALWLGHILFELPAILLVSIVVTVIFATLSSQFNGIGVLFICFVLYGVASTLYSYMFALFLNSPLAAWALVAGINVILFLLYLYVAEPINEQVADLPSAAYLLILTYDISTGAPNHVTICHFTIALINPTPNISELATLPSS